jgi:hypothetical protein
MREPLAGCKPSLIQIYFARVGLVAEAQRFDPVARQIAKYDVPRDFDPCMKLVVGIPLARWPDRENDGVLNPTGTKDPA